MLDNIKLLFKGQEITEIKPHQIEVLSENEYKYLGVFNGWHRFESCLNTIEIDINAFYKEIEIGTIVNIKYKL